LTGTAAPHCMLAGLRTDHLHVACRLLSLTHSCCHLCAGSMLPDALLDNPLIAIARTEQRQPSLM